MKLKYFMEIAEQVDKNRTILIFTFTIPSPTESQANLDIDLDVLHLEKLRKRHSWNVFDHGYAQ